MPENLSVGPNIFKKTVDTIIDSAQFWVFLILSETRWDIVNPMSTHSADQVVVKDWVAVSGEVFMV